MINKYRLPISAFILLVILSLLASSASAAGLPLTHLALVSMSSLGEVGDNTSTTASLSADGKLVAFTSLANNLAGTSNGISDIFVRDILAGTTAVVSLNSSGVQANGTSTESVISGNGRYVAFTSSATNLTTTNTNNLTDVYVRDLQSGITSLVSANISGNEGNGTSSIPSISADGRYVAFLSTSTDLGPGGIIGRQDVYVRDLLNNTTVCASVDSGGVRANSRSFNLSISSTGRYVVFSSTATNLVAGDSNNVRDIFLRDMVNNTTTRISLDSSAGQANGNSEFPAVTPDGRFVVFISEATNLVNGDLNSLQDIFVHDTLTGATTLVSVDSSNTQGNMDNVSWIPSITADGRYVVFDSQATNLVNGDTNGVADVFVHDLLTGETRRLSVDAGGVEGSGASTRPAFSADGRYVAFQSLANNLDVLDTNNYSDIFVRPLTDTAKIFLPNVMR